MNINKKVAYIEPPKEPLYTPIPKFYDANWPKTCNIPCYMCTIITNRIPFFVPSIITSTNVIHRGDHPIVCGPRCGMSWIIEKAVDESEKRKYISYMCEFIFQLTGIRATIIEPAPDRIELQKYGGSQTEHQYQSELILASGPYMKYLYSDIDDYYYDLS